MSEFFKSKWVQVVIVCLAGLILLTGSFWLGVNIGARKSRHFNDWCGNFDRQMPGREDRGIGQGLLPPPPVLPGSHGVFGKVISVSGSSLVIQGKDNLEQDVLVTTSTQIRLGRDQAALQDVKADMEASVLGAPNSQGQIEARLIRLFEGPPANTSATNGTPTPPSAL